MCLELLSFLVGESRFPEVSELVVAGRIQEALTKAEQLLDDRLAAASGRDESLSQLATQAADLMLTLDRLEDAEETYRLSVKHAASRRGAVRVASCRSAGLLGLHQHRFAAAAACFERIESDDAATPLQKLEAVAALSIVRLALGDAQGSLDTLARADAYAAKLPGSGVLVDLLRAEHGVRIAIRSHGELRDHIFWSGQALPAGRALEPRFERFAGLCPVLARRVEFFRDLLAFSRGDHAARGRLSGYLQRLRQSNFFAVEMQARLDCALASLAQRDVDFVRVVLEPLARERARPWRRLWNLELVYCHAKINMLSGRYGEAIVHYQRYAREAMDVARDRVLPAGRTAEGAIAAHDDIAARLPAKYRRAYRYMREHLDCAGLSVREIADDMGVTERALQSAFKTHLGMTPGEVLQRCRVERIRAELLREDLADISVIETAARWGIRNRSTLTSSYRKYFRETPTQTLARRESANASSLA